MDRDFAPARGVAVGKREWKASDFVIDVGRHWDGYSFSVRDCGDPTILIGRGRGAATREDAVAAHTQCATRKSTTTSAPMRRAIMRG